MANQEGRYNREEFQKGDKVYIQDPSSKQWTKEGEVSHVRKYNGKPRSYIVTGSDGGEYLRNGRYLHLKPPQGTERNHN